jgi:hypothetical protein
MPKGSGRAAKETGTSILPDPVDFLQIARPRWSIDYFADLSATHDLPAPKGASASRRGNIAKMIRTLFLLFGVVATGWGQQAVPVRENHMVFLVGSIHNGHFQDPPRYSLPDLKAQVLALNPDLICGEITPEAYQQPLEGYFPPEAAFLDEVAREHGIRFAPIDWRMDSARQSEAEAAEPRSLKEKAKAHTDKLTSQIKTFTGSSLYDFLHSPECLSAIDALYEEIKGENTVSDIAAGSWHERNRRMAANCLRAAGARRIAVIAGVDHLPQLQRQFRALGIEARVPPRHFTPAGQGEVSTAVLARWERNLDNLRAILSGRTPASADALRKVKESRRIQDLEEAIRLYSRPTAKGPAALTPGRS